MCMLGHMYKWKLCNLCEANDGATHSVGYYMYILYCEKCLFKSLAMVILQQGDGSVENEC